MPPSIPHLRATKTSHQLIVHDSSFLLLPAELHNSTLSSASYMHSANIWANMKAMHINTLLGSVSWSQIEPSEASFDFSNLDAILASAREHGMKLILLWFGSFKNGLSTYVPGWVKKDTKRFPRARILEAGGRRKTLDLLSPFVRGCWEADARAFAALMGHLREVDGVENTVLMVQVENECGVLGDSRDRSREAEMRWRENVPRDLMRWLREKGKEGRLHAEFLKRFPEFGLQGEGDGRGVSEDEEASWTELFGERDVADAEEMFMADAFSRYIQQVAEAGKAAYPLPMYTNAWLNFSDPSDLDLEGVPVVGFVGGGSKAGVYPSGGPCPHALDIYTFNAPALDFISPDLYLHEYENMCRHYRHQSQPLFIPEQRRDEKGARRIWSAYANHLALGCSPFGIDSLQADDCAFTKHYRLLHSLRHQILNAQANRPEDMLGFYFDDFLESQRMNEKPWEKTMGDFHVKIERAFVFGKPGPGAGMVIHQGDGKFLCAGWGFSIYFKSTNPKSTFTGILTAEEKEVDAKTGELSTLRWLGGDETRSGACLIMPNEDPDYGGFPIAVTIPAWTCIAECWAYSVEEGEDDA